MKWPSRRSVVHSTKGIVACTQPLAAKCGIDILNAGGNAAVSALPDGSSSSSSYYYYFVGRNNKKKPWLTVNDSHACQDAAVAVGTCHCG